MVPREDIEACADSHARVLASLSGLTDAQAREPSLLPGWTVGHVLTHLARNADSVVRRLSAAADGRLVTQYEGGAEGRAAAIEAGAGRPAAELVSDLASASAAVDALFLEVPAEVWEREVMAGSGPKTIPAPRLVWSRWREVEIHHVDLGRGYLPGDWPAALVERQLREGLEGLASRTDAAALLAWVIGRGGPPQLEPWG